MDEKLDVATLGVRAGQKRTEFQEHAEALFLTSSFVFESAAPVGLPWREYTKPGFAP